MRISRPHRKEIDTLIKRYGHVYLLVVHLRSVGAVRIRKISKDTCVWDVFASKNPMEESCFIPDDRYKSYISPSAKMTAHDRRMGLQVVAWSKEPTHRLWYCFPPPQRTAKKKKTKLKAKPKKKKKT